MENAFLNEKYFVIDLEEESREMRLEDECLEGEKETNSDFITS
jgi:hypothetical protein